MKKSRCLLFLLLIGVLSCDCQETSQAICGTENPTEDLPWLKTLIESWDNESDVYTYLYVQQGEYLGQTVFLPGNCCPFCGTIVGVYDCEGELLWYTSNDLEKTSQIKNRKIIWKPAGYQCTLQ